MNINDDPTRAVTTMLNPRFTHRLASRPSKALLTASLGSACCLVSPWAIAVNFVTNCADVGSGSLREAILGAPENGVVDATGLAGVCSVITVKTGDIQVAVNDLTILGPGADALVVSALYIGQRTFHHYQSRIFNHTGTGTLTLLGLSISDGLLKSTGTQSIYGGCIYSKGNVSLLQSAVYGCAISSTTATAVVGGGIDAHGKVYLLNSQITNNTVTGGVFSAFGGGVESAAFEAHGAVISGNTLAGGSGNYSVVQGGGLHASGTIDIENTTIAGNSASGGRLDHNGQQSAVGGGMYAYGTVTVRNSTISHNSSGGNVGGLNANGKSLTLLNSTIAFNHRGDDNSAGVSITSKSLDLESAIIANNTWGSAGAGSDLGISTGTMLAGSHNLVFATSANVPADTLVGKCPLLGPLRNNGGATPTHALLSHSPAIDAGSNPANLSNDQRGSPYMRTLGAGTDIGSYEVNPADIVFNSGFDGC